MRVQAHALLRLLAAACLHAGCGNPAPAQGKADAATQQTKESPEAETVLTAAADGGMPKHTASGSRPSTLARAGATAPLTAAGAAGSTVPLTAAGAPDAGDSVQDAGSAPKDSGTGAVQSTTLSELCSGCAAEQRDQMDMTIHLHHVHLNVKSRTRSLEFYEKHFKAERVLLNGVTEALHVAPTLILLDEQSSAPNGHLPTALQHMGWGAEDTAAWYEAAHARGLEPDTRGFTLFNTNEVPTVGEPGSGAVIALSGDVPACFPIPDVASYMYVLGPDQERIEVWSGADGRVNHMHFTTADLAASSSWYQRFLGQTGSTPLISWQFFLDDILFFYEPIGAAADYQPTDDHALGHVAFAVTNLDAWRQRVDMQSIEVVSEPAEIHGFRSFFVRGPDGLLIELVQAGKHPELCPP